MTDYAVGSSVSSPQKLLFVTGTRNLPYKVEAREVTRALIMLLGRETYPNGIEAREVTN